jgi:Rrf2 family protein
MMTGGTLRGLGSSMFSQTTEYALRAMACLASRGPASSEAIAAHARVPLRYLYKVMRALVIANLVVSQRGPGGGFSLARPASEISLLEVVKAVESERRRKGLEAAASAAASRDDQIGQVLRAWRARLGTTTLEQVLLDAA